MKFDFIFVRVILPFHVVLELSSVLLCHGNAEIWNEIPNLLPVLLNSVESYLNSPKFKGIQFNHVREHLNCYKHKYQSANHPTFDTFI